MALFGVRNQQPNRLGSLQVQTSEYGVTKPIGWGAFKAPIKLLDYEDFSSKTVSQGGKGGGGGSSYEYYAAVDCLIVQGPIGGFGNVYDGGGANSLIGAVEYYTIPSGGGTYNVGHAGTGFYYDEGVTYTAAYSVGANDFGSDGALVLTGTQQTPMQRGNFPAAGQYSVSTTGGYSFSGADAGKLVAITYAYTTTDTGGDPGSTGFNARPPILRYNLSILLGNTPQPVWGYMETAHPDRALRYDGLARVVSDRMDLGSSANTPNLSIEVLNGRLKAFGNGIADCDPAVVLQDFLGDPVAGCNWPYLADITLFSNFCVANSLFMSPFFDSSSKALDKIKEITDLANAEAVWSGNVLKIVPYGDTTAVGNGRTFIPPTQPVYEIHEDDMLCKPGEEAVEIAWPDLADNYNRVTFEYTDRADNYNTAVIHEQDEASILTNGMLPMQTVTAHHFCRKQYAAVAMNMLLRRNAVPLRTFTFSVPFYYDLAEPMDILLLDLTTGNLGRTPVRVVSKEEDEDYQLKFVCEDFLFGVAEGVVYPKGSANGNQPGAHDFPGATTLLAGFEPSARLTGGTTELWLALTGGPSWGGCNVWLSVDGTDYGSAPIGEQFGSAHAGSLTAQISSGSDPDTANTLAVSLTGSLPTVTQATADALGTLCLVGKELMAYETATLTGSSGAVESYNLTYLRRGVFSTPNTLHMGGEQFVRLDDSIFKYTLDPTLAGKTVFVKFTSTNLYGLEEQDLSEVTAYTFNLSGAAANSTMILVSQAQDATHAQALCYPSGQSYGAAGSYTLNNGAVIALPSQTFSGLAFATAYWVNYDPTQTGNGLNGYVIYTSQSAWLAGQSTGLLNIGQLTTLAQPAAGGGGGGGGTPPASYLPTIYNDTGQSATDNPAGAYTAGQQATLSAYAEYTGGGGGRGYNTNAAPGASTDTAACSWFGFSGTTAAAATLSVTMEVDITVEGTGATGACRLSATLDGSSVTALFSANTNAPVATYTLAVPAGTNLGNTRIYCSCTARAAATNTADVSATAIVTNIHIA